MPDPNQTPAPRILPTTGRVVLFHLGRGDFSRMPEAPGAFALTPDGSNTYAATVAYVHSPGMLNLMVADANGFPHSFTSVPLVQADDERPAGNWCEWMAYQKGQAARAEQLERQIAGGVPTLNHVHRAGTYEAPSDAERQRLQDHVRMERDAASAGTHPAIAATQQLDNNGSPLKLGETGSVTGDGSGQALPTIPQD